MSRTSGWSSRALAREAFRNTLSGRWFSLAIVLTVLAATVGALYVDATQVAAIHRTEQKFLMDGGNIIEITRSENEAKVDAAACSAMGKSTDVIAASAVSSRLEGTHITGRPESMQSIHYATAGFEKIAGSSVTLGANQAISSKIIAERWLASPGAVVGFEPGKGLDSYATIVDVVNMERLGDPFTTTLVMATPATGEADSCFVMAQPWAIERVIQRAPALLGDTKENPLRAGSLQQTGDYFVPFSEQYEERSTAFIPVVTGGAIGLVGAMLLWIRRGRYALYSTLGLSYWQVVQLRLYEWGILLALGVLPGTAIALSLTLGLGLGNIYDLGGLYGFSDLTGLVTSISAKFWAESIVANGLLVGLCGFVVIALAAPLKPSTLAALKDR